MVHFNFKYFICLFSPPSSSNLPNVLPQCSAREMGTDISWIDILLSYHFSSFFHVLIILFYVTDITLNFASCILKFQLSFFYFEDLFLVFWNCLSQISLFFLFHWANKLIYMKMAISLKKKVFFCSLHCLCAFCAPCSLFFCSFYWSLSFVHGSCSDVWWFWVVGPYLRVKY